MSGTRFIAFFLKKVSDGNDLYYHLIVSDCHDIFVNASSNDGELCLASVLVAMLLDERGQKKYEPRATRDTSKYVSQGPARKTRQQSRAAKQASARTQSNNSRPCTRSITAKSRG